MSNRSAASAGPSSRMTSPVASTYDGGQHSRRPSTSTNPAPSLPPSTSSSSQLQQQQSAQPNAPTLISYGSKSVRARVDREVPIDEIIRFVTCHALDVAGQLADSMLLSQLCASPQLAIQEPAALFCLRDASNNDLLTPDNMQRKLDLGVSLKLVASPVIEAADTIEKLLGKDTRQIKQATFALRTFVRVRNPCLGRLRIALMSLPGRCLCKRISSKKWSCSPGCGYTASHREHSGIRSERDAVTARPR